MTNNRRDFIKKTTAGSLALTLGGLTFPAMANARILGANDHINCAVIGVRSRAKAHVRAIHANTNAKILYNCDVDDVIIEEHNIWCQKTIGYVPKVEKDFRKILEDKDVDAVFIATPEHWHAPMAIMAMQAGKHVYIEKPCSHNPHENDLLVAAQNKYGKKVQMGNQQRSAQTSIQGIKDIRAGEIGEVYKGEAYYSNNRGSIGKGKEITVPKTLDWDLWQGPAPREAYRDNIHPYNWHWFKTWGTGEMHNNGTHEVDICRWALGVDLPESVTSFGGKHTFDGEGYFNYDAQAFFGAVGTGITPAMVVQHIGLGSQYLATHTDNTGTPFDGAKNYKLHVPANVPVKDFWSVLIYDAASRSMLKQSQPFPAIDSYSDLNKNEDGSIDLYFGPTAPQGKESNWIETVPNKGFLVEVRLYGALQPYFDRTWKINDVEKID